MGLRLITGLIAKIRERGIKASLERAGPWLWGKYFQNHPRWHKIIFSVLSRCERWMPLPERNKGTLYAFYDLATTTPTFDIGSFMPLAESERQKKGCRDMVLVVVPANDQSLVREIGWEQNRLTAKENDLWRLRHIVEPFCGLYEHCRGPMICGTRREARSIMRRLAKHIYPSNFTLWIPRKVNFWKNVEVAFRGSTKTETICISKRAKQIVEEWRKSNKFDRPIVTVTLREASYNTTRNSNIPNWIRIIEWLDARGYQPVVLRDNEKAFSRSETGLLPWQSFPEAIWNLEIRAALYEEAFINLMVSGGPAILCVTNKNTRYIYFKHVAEGCNLATEEVSLENDGLRKGEQFCTGNEFQKLIWEDDEYDIIEREFIDMEGKLLG